jgi:hypothetical protein
MPEPLFVMVYHAELDLLSDDPRALQVWLSLVRFADFKTQACYPSLSTLARTIGSEKDTVRRAIQRLAKLGLLHVEKRNSATNVFHLQRRDSTEGGSTDATPPVATEQGGGSTDATPRLQPSKGGVARMPPKQEPYNKNQTTRSKEQDSNGGGGGNDLSSTRREPSERVEVENRLRATGMAEWETALRDAEKKGICDRALLQLCDQWEAQRAKFNGPGALLYRIQKGTWPVDGVSEVSQRNDVNDERKERERWQGLCYDAFQMVRQHTATGECVDDLKVIECAIGKGVPEWFARQERGLTTSTPASDASQSPPASQPSVMSFPTSSGKRWDLSRQRLDTYQATHGDHIDVMMELRKARQWLTDNKRKRKSASGMPAFLTRWLNRASDYATSNGRPASATEEDFDSFLDRALGGTT